MNKNINISMNGEYIKIEAKIHTGRKLTLDEYEEVCEGINAELSVSLREKISMLVDFNDIIERNKNAEESFPHFKVLHRKPSANKNTSKSKFEVEGVFKTKEDAQYFANHDLVKDFGEWYVVYTRSSRGEEEGFKFEF
jgi:hypothetical protein